MAWATVEQLADEVGADVDDRMRTDLAAALTWAHARRRDLDPDAEQAAIEGIENELEEDAVTVPTKVTKAVIMLAAMLWRQRANTTGAAYPALGDDSADDDGAYSLDQVYRLIGRAKGKVR